jgi:hypothetical protein
MTLTLWADHVVEFAGDPSAFAGGSPPGLLGLLGMQPAGQNGQPAGPPSPRPDDPPDRPGHDDGRDTEHGAADVVQGGYQRHDDGIDDDARQQAAFSLPAILVRASGVHRDQGRQQPGVELRGG